MDAIRILFFEAIVLMEEKAHDHINWYLIQINYLYRINHFWKCL
jgi:hypothetical protein